MKEGIDENHPWVTDSADYSAEAVCMQAWLTPLNS